MNRTELSPVALTRRARTKDRDRVAQSVSGYYDGSIMMSKTQIALEPEMQQRARKRAAQLGVSFAEYVRRLVARDLAGPQATSDPTVIFDLGRSADSDVASEKDRMVVEAVAARRSRRPSDR